MFKLSHVISGVVARASTFPTYVSASGSEPHSRERFHTGELDYTFGQACAGEAGGLASHRTAELKLGSIS